MNAAAAEAIAADFVPPEPGMWYLQVTRTNAAGNEPLVTLSELFNDASSFGRSSDFRMVAQDSLEDPSIPNSRGWTRSRSPAWMNSRTTRASKLFGYLLRRSKRSGWLSAVGD